MEFKEMMFDGSFRQNWSGDGAFKHTTASLVDDYITPDSYSNYGSVEGLEHKVDRLSILVAKLVDKLPPEEVVELFKFSIRGEKLVYVEGT